ncbi:MAG: hypothetical protein JRN06_12280 [Nitrososphaerota archaeon]|nr:hypothetical protein [Nitrososphaerota archaeon]
MHRLSLISLAALVAVGGILAFAVFVHPALLSSPAQPQAGPPVTGSSGAGSNSTLLSQPPASQTGGDDGGGGSLDS